MQIIILERHYTGALHCSASRRDLEVPKNIKQTIRGGNSNTAKNKPHTIRPTSKIQQDSIIKPKIMYACCDKTQRSIFTADSDKA